MEVLFLTKTFPELVKGGIDLETDDTDTGDYYYDDLNIVADDELFSDFF